MAASGFVSWNPVTGCDEVSPGCDQCYARRIAERARERDGAEGAYPDGFAVTLRPERLRNPFGWRRPRNVFVNSMSDLFHPRVPEELIAEAFAVMALTPQHRYLILTKRHARMRALLSSERFREAVEEAIEEETPLGALLSDWPLPNLRLGVSVEDQRRAELRIPALAETPAAVRLLSCEPLLGPLDLTPHLAGIALVVVGGETGPDARPLHPEWVRELRRQCASAGVRMRFKAWGEWAPAEVAEELGVTDTAPLRFVHRVPELQHLETAPGPRHVGMFRVGRRDSGRVLDGVADPSVEDEQEAAEG